MIASFLMELLGPKWPFFVLFIGNIGGILLIIWCVVRAAQEQDRLFDKVRDQRGEVLDYWLERVKFYSDKIGKDKPWSWDDYNKAQEANCRMRDVRCVSIRAHVEAVKKGQDWRPLYPKRVFERDL